MGGKSKGTHAPSPRNRSGHQPSADRTFSLGLHSAACNDNRAACTAQLRRAYRTVAPHVVVYERKRQPAKSINRSKSRRTDRARRDKHQDAYWCEQHVGAGEDRQKQARQASVKTRVREARRSVHLVLVQGWPGRGRSHRHRVQEAGRPDLILLARPQHLSDGRIWGRGGGEGGEATTQVSARV